LEAYRLFFAELKDLGEITMGDTTEQWEQLKNRLLDNHIWPGSYTFKFLVPKDSLDSALALLEDYSVRQRPSSTGKFIGLTVEDIFADPEQVIAIYQRMAKVPGIMSL
jgi:hypothetical protein